jgi:hypothetical protein
MAVPQNTTVGETEPLLHIVLLRHVRRSGVGHGGNRLLLARLVSTSASPVLGPMRAIKADDGLHWPCALAG